MDVGVGGEAGFRSVFGSLDLSQLLTSSQIPQEQTTYHPAPNRGRGRAGGVQVCV